MSMEKRKRGEREAATGVVLHINTYATTGHWMFLISEINWLGFLEERQITKDRETGRSDKQQTSKVQERRTNS